MVIPDFVGATRQAEPEEVEPLSLRPQDEESEMLQRDLDQRSTLTETENASLDGVGNSAKLNGSRSHRDPDELSDLSSEFASETEPPFSIFDFALESEQINLPSSRDTVHNPDISQILDAPNQITADLRLENSLQQQSHSEPVSLGTNLPTVDSQETHSKQIKDNLEPVESLTEEGQSGNENISGIGDARRETGVSALEGRFLPQSHASHYSSPVSCFSLQWLLLLNSKKRESNTLEWQ